MDKYEYIVNLAEKTAKRVSQNRESWMKFLTSAARIYKYPFKEQLLIYAQNPDATACASIEIWNKRMNCWVNKGSSGIALPDDTATYGHKLKYVVLKKLHIQITFLILPLEMFRLDNTRW